MKLLNEPNFLMNIWKERRSQSDPFMGFLSVLRSVCIEFGNRMSNNTLTSGFFQVQRSSGDHWICLLGRKAGINRTLTTGAHFARTGSSPICKDEHPANSDGKFLSHLGFIHTKECRPQIQTTMSLAEHSTPTSSR